MATFTPEQAEAIIAESFALLERRRGQEITSTPEPTHEEIRQALAEPCETSSERHRRKATERQEHRMMERDRRRDDEANTVRTTSTMDAASQASWDAWALAHIANEREFQREVHAQVIAEERKHIRAELKRMRSDFELKLDELRTELTKQRGIEGGGIVDLLPPVPLRKRGNAAS
jgi:hypothetical protein